MANLPDRQAFVLERYKYILSQKQALDRVSIHVIAIFQGGLGLIVSGQFAIVASFKTLKIDAVTAWLGSVGLLGLMCVLAGFAASLIVSGVYAWVRYRKDEALVEEEVFAISRPLPRFGDVFSWYETYIVVAIIAILATYIVTVVSCVFPMFS